MPYAGSDHADGRLLFAQGGRRDATSGGAGLEEGSAVPPGESTAESKGEESLALRPQKILIVDDEVDILESLKDLFEVSLDKIEVRTAESGAAALKILESDEIDLVISDYKMPGMNGLEFLHKAREVAPSVPRILATAFPDLDIAVRAINETEIQNFITKPFEPEKAIELVRSVLDRRRAGAMRDRSFARSMEVFRKSRNDTPPKA